MMMPVFLTSLGSRPSAWFTRFCTSTLARSTSRVTSNTTVIWLEPSLPLADVMYFIPGTPLIACSSGIVTADSTVCAFAPMYPLLTTTCGGANSGNCAMGKDGIAIAPPRMISSAHTVANTGLSMKKSTNTVSLASDLEVCSYDFWKSVRRSGFAVCRRCSGIPSLLHHRHSVLHELRAGRDDVLSALQPAQHRVVVPQRLAHFQNLLTRKGPVRFFRRHKREKLSVDAHHREDRHNRPFVDAPRNLRAHLLRNAQFRRRVRHERFRQHGLRVRIHLRRYESYIRFSDRLLIFV